MRLYNSFAIKPFGFGDENGNTYAGNTLEQPIRKLTQSNYWLQRLTMPIVIGIVIS